MAPPTCPYKPQEAIYFFIESHSLIIIARSKAVKQSIFESFKDEIATPPYGRLAMTIPSAVIARSEATKQSQKRKSLFFSKSNIFMKSLFIFLP